MAVSVWFLAPSVQLGVVHLVAEHSVLVQSVPAPQFFPPSQHAQLVEPPQSTSVSPPFLTLSLHAAAAHSLPVVQTPSTQSVPAAHTLPTPHFAAQLPPQSTSVSVPFFTPSLHTAA
jgi:hypothetical protein